jgi:2'-5' RNA ligase
VGLQGDLERLARLQAQVVSRTADWGRIEERGFHPHLTLGRVQAARPRELQQIADALGAISVPPCAPWRAEHVHLMESVLAPGGSEYSKLASFDLAAGGKASE